MTSDKFHARIPTTPSRPKRMVAAPLGSLSTERGLAHHFRTSACADRTPVRLVRGGRCPGWNGRPAYFGGKPTRLPHMEPSASAKTAARFRVSPNALSQPRSGIEVGSHLRHQKVVVAMLPHVRGSTPSIRRGNS